MGLPLLFSEYTAPAIPDNELITYVKKSREKLKDKSFIFDKVAGVGGAYEFERIESGLIELSEEITKQVKGRIEQKYKFKILFNDEELDKAWNIDLQGKLKECYIIIEKTRKDHCSPFSIMEVLFEIDYIYNNIEGIVQRIITR